MQVLLLFALAHVVSSFHIPYPDEAVKEWELFKIEHEKLYGDEKEENVRKEIFMKNLDFIRKHNKKYENGEVTFTVGVNQFADMTNQEFKRIMNGLKIPEGYVSKGRKFEWNENMTVPDTVDWRQQGAVTPVKNQGQCGSCWAFSSTGSLEGQTFLKTKTLPSLSEQNLVDCSTAYGNQGCNGGLMSNSYTYIEENNGIDTEASYPYTAQEGACQYEAENRGATDTGYVSIPRSEISLQQAVADVGPISVAIDASQQSFQFYRGGIYIDPGCSTTQLDHAVLVVGYGTSSGYKYWLVKNSWGTTWGMSGYVLMARNFNNMCGIATMASYPTV